MTIKENLRRIGRSSPGDLALALFAVMIVVSILVSPLPARSFAALPPLLGGLLLYFLLTRWPITIAYLHRIWWGLILVGTVIALVAPPSTFAPSHMLFRWFPWWARLRPYLPDTFNENVISGALVVLLPYGAARVLLSWQAGYRAGWGEKILAAMMVAIPLAIVAMSTSRGAYIAVAIAALVFGGFWWPRLSRWVIPVAIIAAVIAGTVVGWSVVADALLTSQATQGLNERLEIWSRALMLIQDFPFTGAGLNCFEPVIAALYPLFLIAGGTISHAHDLYLQIAADVGVPGLIAYLALLGLSIHSGVVAYRAFRSQGQRALALLSVACLASLAGIFVQGLFDAVAWGNKGAFLPWVTLGLSIALYRFNQDKTESTSR